ncbi:hypothetical protein MP638_007059 [Amoeboaphelidium occidentale]|nr:hypothetical protein MP638_007059 [Amoeboaphelidium occidentale]
MCYPSSSRPGSPNGLRDDVSSEVLRHHAFRNSLVERDEVCLFCWKMFQLQAAHIVAQKKNPVAAEEEILRRAGLISKHQVQNGLLLCSACHGEFDLLKYYVDIAQANNEVIYFLEIVKGKLQTEEEWVKIINYTKDLRRAALNNFTSDRCVVEDDGRIRLWFMNPFGDSNQTEDLRPKVEALSFHKTACLILRMAVLGKDDDDYYYGCCDDDCGNENVFSQQRTEEFVSSVVAALEEAAQQGRLGKEPPVETEVLEETKETT